MPHFLWHIMTEQERVELIFSKIVIFFLNTAICCVIYKMKAPGRAPILNTGGI